MENSIASRAVRLAFLLIVVCAALLGCRKKSTPAQGVSPSPAETRPSLEIQASAGFAQPATVGQGEGSFSKYIHFPEDAQAAKLDSAVQFYCDVSSEGVVESTYAVLGKQDEFKKAVRTALDWGHFTSATVDGKPTPVYLGGTVLFMHQDGQRVIVISLATADRARVGKLARYVQPQLIGGLRRRLEAAESRNETQLPNQGGAEVLAKISERGDFLSSSIVAEAPKEIGLGEFLTGSLKGARFTPAYQDGKPVAGQLNVVANLGEF